MPDQAAAGAWKRLGELLELRRVGLDPRYKNLTLFSAEREVDYRLAWDIEHGRRTNFRRPTLTSIEAAYGWEHGSIRAVLAGGDPSPVAVPADERPDVVKDHWADEIVRLLWDSTAHRPLPERTERVTAYLAAKAANGNDVGRRA